MLACCLPAACLLLNMLQAFFSECKLLFLNMPQAVTQHVRVSHVPGRHQEGICRFSTADYDPDDLSEENRRAHLT